KPLVSIHSGSAQLQCSSTHRQRKIAMENSALFGKWESYKSDNLDVFFEKLGMGWLQQKIGPKLTSTLLLEKLSDSELKLSVSSLGFHDETIFKVDGIVQWSGGAKELHDALTKWEDGKLVIYTGPLNSASADDVKANSQVKIVREITGDGELLMTIIHPEVTATRHYKKKN
ncbi:hypothetical protein BOX15_Mlig027163g2, partial [Macrostomum lignano]